MLAGAPRNLFCSPGFPLESPGISRLYLHPRLVCRNSAGDGSCGGVRSSGRKWKLSVGAGYKRIPMETAGAYQLIDDETGEKLIVWGGTDDALDSPIPAKEALSWKPNQRASRYKERLKEGVEVTRPVSEPTGKPMAHIGGSLGSFDRLKAPQIKALIKEAPRVSKENDFANKNLSVDLPLDGANYSDPEIQFINTKAGSDLLIHRELNYDTVDEKVQAMNPMHITPKRGLESSDVHKSVPRFSSEGWSDAGSVHNMTIAQRKKHRKVPADSGFFSRKSFKDLGCSDDMINSLSSQSFLRPSHIQAMAYGPVLEGQSCIIADQSGSGKTLAYLGPVIQRLRQEEVQGLGKSSSKSPRVVILAPTTELASQVLNNCRSIAKHGVPFRSMVATGGFRQKTQLENLQQEMDVLIATPGRFIFLLQEGFVQLTNLKCIVLDEVDILFGDEGFEQVLQSLISSAPLEAQYLFATATLPVDIYNKLVEVFPDCEVIMGPGIHRTSSRLEEVLLDCSGDDGEEKNPDTAFHNKKSALLQLVQESPVPKTIVFCNKIETCRKVENVLNRFDRKGFRIKVLPFHAALQQEIRLRNLGEFLSSHSKDSMFLICTDRASRGIDFSNVDHVVLFDFPRDPSEYVRRVGRTARGAVGEGKAFVFVVGKQVSLAKRIMERNKKGHPLHDVPTAYELESTRL